MQKICPAGFFSYRRVAYIHKDMNIARLQTGIRSGMTVLRQAEKAVFT